MMLHQRTADGDRLHIVPREPLSPARWRIWLWLTTSLALAVMGTWLVHDAVAVPATTWMHMYDPHDFPTLADLLAFVRALRVPIPPVIAALEILSVQHTGTTDLVTKDLYRLSLVGSYVLALWLTYPSLLRLGAAVAGAIIFLWATTLMHPLNAQVYDVVLPFCVLGFLLLLRASAAVIGAAPLATLLSAGAGVFLAMAELSRPFVLLTLPVLLLGAYLAVRSRPRAMLALLVPVAVLSGLWHLHLYAAHGQVLATNYAGFNLRRAWPQAPLPAGMYETSSTPSDTHSWPNINTREQLVASQMLQRTIVHYAVTHPVDALGHAIARVALFARPQTSMYGSVEPQQAIMAAYKIAVPLAVLYLFANLIMFGGYVTRARARAPLLLAHPDNLLLLFAAFTLLALSLGEANEEARLIVTVLPFLAAIPTAQPLPPVGAGDHASRRP